MQMLRRDLFHLLCFTLLVYSTLDFLRVLSCIPYHCISIKDEHPCLNVPRVTVYNEKNPAVLISSYLPVGINNVITVS